MLHALKADSNIITRQIGVTYRTVRKTPKKSQDTSRIHGKGEKR
ncbi:hypothetical protein [Anaerosporobacter faecicola]|nr:hypothetical protein [Anaerosporobacter faecicola]